MRSPDADLVALALGALDPDASRRTRARLEADPDAQAELDEIQAHLRLHDALPIPAPQPPHGGRLGKYTAPGPGLRPDRQAPAPGGGKHA
ncbi:MAG: hypothetical protein ACT4PV_06860, partial [Planctomycetaceae bacterium]